MIWLLAYLLAGFALSWSAAVVLRLPVDNWRWELAAVAVWPVAIAFAIWGMVEGRRDLRARRKRNAAKDYLDALHG